LGPIIGSLFIFSKTEYTAELLSTMSPEQIEAARIAEALSVQGTYLVIAALVGALALLFAFTKLPEVGQEEEQASGSVGIFELLRKYKHLSLGVLAQFANVGAQATLWGYFVDFKMDFAQNTHLGIAASYADLIRGIIGDDANLTPEKMAGFHASFAMVLFMLGRFIGTYLMTKFDARRVVSWYSIAAVILVALAFLTGGLTGILCLMLTYFCQSIMFPTIFALSTKGMAPAESKLASSLVIMAIVGGAVMPPIAGLLSVSGGMKMALVVPFICFGYVVYYVLKGAKTEGV
jgi:FHS family L-fucose permease-like MFS transporter